MRCEQCGGDNPEGMRFCNRCGQQLVAGAGGAAAPAPASRPAGNSLPAAVAPPARSGAFPWGRLVLVTCSTFLVWFFAGNLVALLALVLLAPVWFLPSRWHWLTFWVYPVALSGLVAAEEPLALAVSPLLRHPALATVAPVFANYQLAAIHASRANAHFDARRYEEALEEIELAISLEPVPYDLDRPDHFWLRATILDGLGRYEEALADITLCRSKASATASMQPRYCELSIRLRLKTHDCEAARREFEQFSAALPTYFSRAMLSELSESVETCRPVG
ncbi:MAG: hypothetical protein ACYC4L_14200 [Chloroflexota bacterium]